MWTLRLALALFALTRTDFALGDACEPPQLDVDQAGISVTFEHEADLFTLTFRREGKVIGERVLDVRDADCSAMTNMARLVVELTLEEIAFAEEEHLRALSTAPTQPTTEPTTPAHAPALVATHSAEPTARDAARDAERAPVVSIAEPSTFRLGTTADVGIGVAFASYASVVASAVVDAAYAPASASVAPEISGRAGLFTALPSHSLMEERDVWLSVVASRWDVCGGVRGKHFRARGCAGTIAGSMLAEGAQGSAIVSVGARLEAAWQATHRTALLIAAEALSIQLPTRIDVIVEEWADPVTEEVSPISLMFSTGVTGDWLTL